MIAVDASIALKLVLQEPDSQLAQATWQTWTKDSEVVIAPGLFRAETLSVVRRKVHQGLLSEPDGEQASTVLDNLAVQIGEPGHLYAVAWRIAKRFNRPTIYDSCYLALAFIVGCELWTADHRLANAVRTQLPWVRLLGA
ncbi:MAG: type II toxin-antitoxin system VapC family toxin [Dehalococcoidia bacterium]|nr:type II toxin-antitoxin system VapC family toxin [Dehalococcoidia bacterium]